MKVRTCFFGRSSVWNLNVWSFLWLAFCLGLSLSCCSVPRAKGAFGSLPIFQFLTSKQKLLPPGKSQHGPILCHLSRTYPCYRPTLAILSMAALSLWYLPKPFTAFRLTGTSWCPQSRSNSSCRFFGSVSKLIITCNLLKLSTYIILVSEITRNCQSRLYSNLFILFYFVLIGKIVRKCANLSCNNLFNNLFVSKYITFFSKSIFYKSSMSYIKTDEIWVNDKTIVELNKVKIIDVDTFLINFKKCIDIHLSQKNSVELLHNKSKIKKSVSKRKYQNKKILFKIAFMTLKKR